jgi:hypothetical protein
VQAAGETGGDAVSVVWRTITGLLEAGRETGANLGKLAEAAATGATDTGSNIGSVAAGAVHQALLGFAHGVKNVLPATPVPASATSAIKDPTAAGRPRKQRTASIKKPKPGGVKVSARAKKSRVR